MPSVHELGPISRPRTAESAEFPAATADRTADLTSPVRPSTAKQVAVEEVEYEPRSAIGSSVQTRAWFGPPIRSRSRAIRQRGIAKHITCNRWYAESVLRTDPSTGKSQCPIGTDQSRARRRAVY